jgi:hypothetical protein
MLTNFPNGLSSFGLPVFGGVFPPILGTLYHASPYNGNNSNPGLDRESPLDDLVAAYDKCVSGAGDGILAYSGGTAAAETTSYLEEALTWSKHGITIYGAAAATRMFQRARIANKSTVLDLAKLLEISGDNNAFFNLHLFQGGSNAAALGCVLVSGNRNLFVNCHFAGGGHATPAAQAGMYSLKLTGHENTFIDCVFGTDTIIRGAANGEILLSGEIYRNRFYNCEVISYSTTAGKGAIKIDTVGTLNRNTIFNRCLFTNFQPGAISALTSVVIGADPTSGIILLRDCAQVGWAAWDATTSKVYVVNGAADNAAGGKAVAAH